MLEIACLRGTQTAISEDTDRPECVPYSGKRCGPESPALKRTGGLTRHSGLRALDCESETGSELPSPIKEEARGLASNLPSQALLSHQASR